MLRILTECDNETQMLGELLKSRDSGSINKHFVAVFEDEIYRGRWVDLLFQCFHGKSLLHLTGGSL